MIEFISIPGLVSYERGREYQLKMVEERVADLRPDTLLFLEHEPVITRGRGLQFTGEVRPRHTPIDPWVLPTGMAFSESERGGDLTYHGPGQLVVYPIVKLDGRGWGPHHDIGAFLRKIEKLFLDELRSLGLPRGESREGATGVWVGDRKIASMGIAVRKWVTYHGLAINVVNDLAPFSLFSPCGFQSEVMTRLKDFFPDSALPEGLESWHRWRPWLEARLRARLQA